MWRVLGIMTLIFSSASLHAEYLGAADIKQTHYEVEQSFKAQCHQKMPGASNELCACLANIAETNLDDDALANCTNDDSGFNCVSSVVTEATTKALSQESINTCLSRAATIHREE